MVQRYILSDYKKLLAIWERTSKNIHTFFTKGDYDNIHKNIQEYIKNMEFYVYKKNGKDIAYMGIKEDKIEVLFCEVEYLNQGAGSFMLDYAINLLNVRYADVHENNTVALEFYKKHGFEEVTRTTHDIFGFPVIHLSYEPHK